MSTFPGLQLTSSRIRCPSAVCRLKTRCATRGIHKRLPLPYSIDGGLGRFLPPDALKAVAVDYQEGLLQRLDAEVGGSKEEQESLAQTVLNTASSRKHALAFNYASLALNNSFFLAQLKPPPTEPKKTYQNKIETNLRLAISKHYGNITQLKSTFSSAATGMFTSGCIWLVTDKSGNLGIIPTFGSGTLLIRSRMNMSNFKEFNVNKNLKMAEKSPREKPPDENRTSREAALNGTLNEEYDDGEDEEAEDEEDEEDEDEEEDEEDEEEDEEDEEEDEEDEEDEDEDEDEYEASETDLAELESDLANLNSLIAGIEGPLAKSEAEPDFKGDLTQVSSSPIGTTYNLPGVNPSSPASGVSSKRPPMSPSGSHSRSFGSDTTSLNQDVPNIFDGSVPAETPSPIKTDKFKVGEVLHPLFCISVQEHAWIMAGFGVWGKEEWLKQFWTVLDWKKISNAYDSICAK